jgi:hypothetical protein
MTEDYRDSNGNPCSLAWLVENEREWAESRLRHMRSQVEQQAAEIERLQANYNGCADTCSALHKEVDRLRALLRRVQACGLNESPPGVGFATSKQERVAGQLHADIGAALADQKEGKA